MYVWVYTYDVCMYICTHTYIHIYRYVRLHTFALFSEAS